jgi:hypothetical protein
MRDSLRKFMDSVQKRVGHHFLLRTVPLEILRFTPTTTRMRATQERAIQNQYDVLATWMDELDNRFSDKERNLPVYAVPMDN